MTSLATPESDTQEAPRTRPIDLHDSTLSVTASHSVLWDAQCFDVGGLKIERRKTQRERIKQGRRVGAA